MDLNKYLSSNGAPSVSELRQALVALGYDVKSNAQIRQWRRAYQGRRPSPENCAGLEQVTKGVVTRSELRPDDFFLIWPELTKHGCAEHAAHHNIVD